MLVAWNPSANSHTMLFTAPATHVVLETWVWFDALPNYLTATGYPDGDWRDRWPAAHDAAV